MDRQTPSSQEDNKMHPPRPAGITGAFELNMQAPYPWRRAISAGLAMGIPILVGVAFGQFRYGMLASMGAFTYLYSGDEPYRRRAILLTVVMIALAICFGAGSYSAALPFWVTAVVIGFITAVAVFACDVFDVGPPGPLFFFFITAIGTSMPSAHPADLMVRVGLVLVGAIPAWFIGMSGWIFDPLGPETRAVTATYRSFAAWLAAVGTNRLHAAEHQAATALRSSERAVAAGRSSRRRPEAYRRLAGLNEQAEAVFFAIIELTAERSEPVDPQLIAAVRALADAAGSPGKATSMPIPEPPSDSHPILHLYGELKAAVAIAADEQPNPLAHPEAPRGTIGDALAAAFERTSPIVPKAVRFGLVLMFAHLIASMWGTPRPYWVVLSTGAVLMGPTVAATLHRAVQRLVGTVIGTSLGAILLSLNPSGLSIAIAFLVLQVLAQLSLVRNYGLAVAFFTPLGLMIAHAGHPELPASYLLTARLLDIMLGSVLGFAGAMLFGRRSASRRLPGLLSDALRREGHLMEALLTDRSQADEAETYRLRTLLVNLRVVYDAAVNELERDRSRMESLWPAVIGVQRLGFFLIAMTEHEGPLAISKESLAQLKSIFDGLASAVAVRRAPTVERIPEIPEYPVISQELQEITQSLQCLRGRRQH